MLLVITGPASVGRDTLITAFLNRHPEWRYMAVEESPQTEFLPEGAEDDETVELDMTEFYVSLACQCAQELKKENLHLVAACREVPPHLEDFLQEELGKEFLFAYLGSPEEIMGKTRSLARCTIDPSVQTLRETLVILDRLVGRKRK